MSLSVEEKVRVAHLLDDLGVPMIEAGFPASNPKEDELFARLETRGPARATCAAFGMTRRRDAAAAEDPALRVLAESFAPVCTLVGKTWGLHLEKVVKVDRDENLRMIAESVAFLVGEGKRVVYDAEHFFDGCRDDRAYALRCLQAAAEAGADNVTLCDTNGASLPARDRGGDRGRRARRCRLRGRHPLPQRRRVRRRQLARRRRARARRMVQGTMNGYGERCGNANLVSIVPNLQLKMGHECLPSLTGLTEAVAPRRRAAQPRRPTPNQPYVGKNAFAHKGGHARGRRQRRPARRSSTSTRPRSATRARC